MQSWEKVVSWFASEDGRAVLFGGITPFVAIVVAGLVAAAIARSAVKRLLRARDRELKTTVLGALVDAARQASVWDSSSPAERALADRAAAEADLQLRLLPLDGSAVAADWAEHSIAELKRSSATFSLQLDGPLAEFRDRLVEWNARPRRARKTFEADLVRWRGEEEAAERRRREEKDAWAAQQSDEQRSALAGTNAAGQSAPGSVEPPTVEPYSPVARRGSDSAPAAPHSLTANAD